MAAYSLAFGSYPNTHHDMMLKKEIIILVLSGKYSFYYIKLYFIVLTAANNEIISYIIRLKELYTSINCVND